MTIYQKLRILGSIGLVLTTFFCVWVLATETITWKAITAWKVYAIILSYFMFLTGWTANKIEEKKKLKHYA